MRVNYREAVRVLPGDFVLPSVLTVYISFFTRAYRHAL